jgi:hypothetical protein
MTEADWLASSSPIALLSYLNADGSSRKLLLYTCALGTLHPEPLSETLRGWFMAVEAVLTDEALANAPDERQAAALHECSHLANRGPSKSRAYHAVLCHVVARQWVDDRRFGVILERSRVLGLSRMRQTAAGLVRELYGNPFRPVTFSPEWRTSTAVAIAQQMYESRDLSAMPILADALQDAGCDNDDILTHCRDAIATHVRGCWVVDLVLDKK